LKKSTGKLGFLFRSHAPIWLISKYFILRTLEKLSPKRRQYRRVRDEFRKEMKTLHFDNDWFSRNIPSWIRAFELSKISRENPMKCLEIGSWQGLSAVFLLHYFKNSSITCVDTWEGADEHQASDASPKIVLSSIETIFDKNLEGYAKRVRKFKGKSYRYFNEFCYTDYFDFIYVDGSHHSDDLIVDAIKSFEALKIGGLMVFDDYFWQYYEREVDNPAGAINCFLRLKRHQLEIVCFGYQVVVKKIASSIRVTPSSN
jgi:predicted O-methyltransferase YrrM